MRTRSPASAATQSHDLPAFYRIALFDFELGKMQVEGEQALAVIEHDEIALEIKRPRQQHCTVIHGGNRSPAGDAKIQAQVRTGSLAVEDAFGTEYVGNLSNYRGSELSRPLAFGRDPVQIVLLNFLAFFYLLLLFGTRLSELAFDAELGFNLRIPGAGDGELAGERNLLARGADCLGLASQVKGVTARRSFHAHSGQREPQLALRIKTENDLMPEPRPI